MKKLFYLIFSVVVVTSYSCKKGEVTPVQTPEVSDMIIVDQNITVSTEWDASRKYLLKGNIYVQAPAELTIPAGTVIMGDKATKGALIINRGAKIHAHGTAS